MRENFGLYLQANFPFQTARKVLQRLPAIGLAYTAEGAWRVARDSVWSNHETSGR